MNLTDRLDELMELRGIKNRHELATLSGIPYTTIDGMYKKGTDGITLKTLSRLSAFFDCSLDFLVSGIDDDPEDAAILDLIEAAQGNDRDDIRRAADTLRKLKAIKEQNARLTAYFTNLSQMR